MPSPARFLVRRNVDVRRVAPQAGLARRPPRFAVGALALVCQILIAATDVGYGDGVRRGFGLVIGVTATEPGAVS